MLNFPVGEQKNKQLTKDMRRLGIVESDLVETFVRSQGPGGQNVNKVSTCVVLKHKPSGLVIRCQKERSQAFNRYRARSLLVIKLDALIHERQSLAAIKISKIRRQKRKRSKRAKDKMLQLKHRQSEKKITRRRVGDED